MYVVKKRAAKAKRQFKRDSDLGFPYHKTDNSSTERSAFITQLMNNKEFVPVRKDNDKKYADTLREIIKHFDRFDRLVMLLLALGLGTGSCILTKDIMDTKQVSKPQKALNLAAFTTLGALLGFAAGFGISVALYKVNKEGAIESCYRRLSVRLFDLLKENYPELDEKILKACNPEMARVLNTLLVANMPKEDVLEIQDLAMKISRELRDLNPQNQAGTLLVCNRYLQTAISIIEHNIITNQFLYDSVLSIYRGNLPVSFMLNNNQKTK